jgi:hypothetical protein
MRESHEYVFDKTPSSNMANVRLDSKKSVKKQNNEIKYCSDRCRSRKPGPLDRKIEKTIASLLNGEEDSGIEKTAARTKAVKGDPRLIITCDEVEEIVFGSRFDPEKVYGRRKNRKSRAIADKNGEWKSVDMESDSDDDDDDPGSVHDDTDASVESIDLPGAAPAVDGGVRVRPPQEQSEVNFSVGGERGKAEKIEESADDLQKRREGTKRAEEREMVRRAARRGVVFGLEVPRREANVKKPSKSKGRRGDDHDLEEPEAATEIRKAEAIMAGMVVEPSFAKGNWSIRWRE